MSNHYQFKKSLMTNKFTYFFWLIIYLCNKRTHIGRKNTIFAEREKRSTVTAE